MIAVLCEPGTEAIGQTVAHKIQTRYASASAPRLWTAEDVWPEDPEWDDLLIVVYGSASLSSAARASVVAYLDTHGEIDLASGSRIPGGFVLPVAVDATHLKPPEPIAGIKAAFYDGSDARTAFMLAEIDVLLGVALRPSDHQIFVSYRATDGGVIAKQLYDRLAAERFDAWLDEAPDKLPPSTDVQKEILHHVASASLVIVVDTPQAPDSEWIVREVDAAIGQLIPVVPVVVGGGDDDLSRFTALRPLQRRAVVKRGGVDSQPLSDDEWKLVRREIEQVLLLSYVRRMRLVSRTRQAFSRKQYAWKELDSHKRMFKARRDEPTLSTVVLSHCAIQDVTYVPGLKAYRDFIKTLPDLDEFNYKLCVYDRDRVLSIPEIQQLKKELGSSSFILAHYNELAMLIAENFARLR